MTNQLNTGDCLSAVDLKAIAHGEITEVDRPVAVLHLGNCQQCQSNLDEMTDAISVEKELRALSVTDRPEIATSEFLTRVIEQLTACPRDQEVKAAAEFDLVSLLEPDPSGTAELGLFGIYEVMDLAGQGGMGVVLKARDPKLDRIVAIKIVSEPNADLRQRFLLEAQSAAALVHENVVTIHAADERKGRPYIVMQYIDGQSLSEMIKENQTLPAEQIVEISRQIAAGLAAAHRRGLIHRDIKPENILIEAETGQALLSDFGLVKHIAPCSDQQSTENLTRPGLMVGTPRYMAPEQANEQPADIRSDLFSLGSVLYSMCTGKAPFGGDSALQILMQVCEQTPESIRNINPAIPSALSSIVEKLHEKNPADRYQSAEELLSALGRLDASGALKTENDSSELAFMKPMRWLWVAGLVGAISLLLYSSGSMRFFSTQSTNHSTTGVPAEFQLVSSGIRFASLSEAIEQAQAEDVIEIRGPGPYPLQQVVVGAEQVLTIRAANATTITGSIQGPMMIVEGNCTLENVHLKHKYRGGLYQILPSQDLQQLRKESVLVVESGGTLSLKHCELDCAPNRVGILHVGKSVAIQTSRIVAPDGIGVAWQGFEKSTLSMKSSHVESLACVSYQSISGHPHFEMRNCNWIAKAESNTKQLSRLLRIDQDSSNENPLTVEFHNNLVVGDMMIVLRGRKSADFLDVNESGNVFSVGGLIKNRNRRATSIVEWKTLIGSESTTSVLVPQLSNHQTFRRDDINWGDETPLNDFGAPEKIGSKK